MGTVEIDGNGSVYSIYMVYGGQYGNISNLAITKFTEGLPQLLVFEVNNDMVAVYGSAIDTSHYGKNEWLYVVGSMNSNSLLVKQYQLDGTSGWSVTYDV